MDLARFRPRLTCMVHPPLGYRFLYDRPNKPLSSYDPENKRDSSKINKTLELWFLWSFWERTQAYGWWILSLPYMRVYGADGQLERCDLDHICGLWGDLACAFSPLIVFWPRPRGRCPRLV